MLDIGPSNSEVIVPIEAPNDPTRMLDAKDIVRQALSLRDLINRILFHDFHPLRQSCVKVEWFGLIIRDHHVAGLGIFTKEFAGLRHGSRIRSEEVTDKKQRSSCKQPVDDPLRNV